MSHTVVVTGGAGFIGSHLVDALVQRGDRVRVVDNLVAGFLRNVEHHGRRIDFIEADVCDLASMQNAFRGAEYVLHHAALASVPLSLERPAVVNRVCVDGTLAVLEAARRENVKRVIYAASSSCYGDSPVSAKRETDPVQPMSPYAVAKLAGEHYCQAYFRSFGLETVCLRYFNVFGPRQDPNSAYSAVIPLFITAILNGQRPIVFGDGQQSRDFTFVANVVHGNLLAMSAPNVAGRTFNLADGRSTTLLQLLELLAKLLGKTVMPDFQKARAGEVRDSLADISQASGFLGYKPQSTFAEGLARSIEYYRDVAGRANPIPHASGASAVSLPALR